MEHPGVQRDWANREFIANVSASMSRIADFLNRFGA